ncbi:TetR/AcrR family transcriptional regulator [Gordonia jacobaea]|uniref:TetR/AcrR family transcriptional regulator n=1 Tax=Gordonia jacobaea TaxID=122202 RepID=UPI003D759C8F
MTSATSGTGRPRDPEKDRAVIASTKQLLLDEGYRGATVAAIARHSGVGAPTIYRRWPRREMLIEDAAFRQTDSVSLPEDQGDLKRNLRAWATVFLATLADPVTRAALPGLISDYQQDPELYQRLLDRADSGARAVFVERLAVHVSGDDPTQVEQRLDVAFDILVGQTLLQALTFGETGRDEFCDRTARALTAMLLSQSWT